MYLYLAANVCVCGAGKTEIENHTIWLNELFFSDIHIIGFILPIHSAISLTLSTSCIAIQLPMCSG